MPPPNNSMEPTRPAGSAPTCAILGFRLAGRLISRPLGAPEHLRPEVAPRNWLLPRFEVYSL